MTDGVDFDKLKEFLSETLRFMLTSPPGDEFSVGYCMAILDLAWTLQHETELAKDAAAMLGFKRSLIDFDPHKNPFLPAAEHKRREQETE